MEDLDVYSDIACLGGKRIHPFVEGSFHFGKHPMGNVCSQIWSLETIHIGRQPTQFAICHKDGHGLQMNKLICKHNE